MSTTGNDYQLISQGFENVVALDFDISSSHIYFTDVKEHKIYKIFFNGTNLEVVVGHDVPSAEGITVDWIARYKSHCIHAMLLHIILTSFYTDYLFIGSSPYPCV